MPGVKPVQGTLRDRQREFTRQQLLESSLLEFQTRGYTATTIDDIVAAAGMSRTTFYLHFKNKEELVAEILAPIRARSSVALVSHLQAVYAATSAAERRNTIGDWIENALVIRKRDLHLIRLSQEAAAHSAVIEPYTWTHPKEIVKAITPTRAPRKKEQAAQIRLQLALLAMWGSFDRILQTWEGAGLVLSETELADYLTDVWFDILSPQLERYRAEIG